MTTINRLKIKTHSPLVKETFQAWVPFDSNQSIHSLKQTICNLLQSTLSISINPIEIILELDACTFLDQSTCSLIDPTRDLIHVKIATPRNPVSPIKSTKKRSRSQSNLEPDSKISQKIPRTTKKSLKQSAQDNPLNNSDQPKQTPDRATKPLLESKSNDQPPIQSTVRKPPVPPGQGKNSTKARNQRKRLKKLRSRGLNNSNQKSSTDLTLNPHSTSVIKSQVSSNLVSNHQPSTANNSSKINQTKTTQNNHENKSDSSSSSESESSSSESSSDSSSSESSSDSSSESSSDSPPSEFRSGSLSSQSSSPVLSCDPPKTSASLQSPASVLQKTVPIEHNPLLTMLSLSNKNKRKNVRKSCPDQLSHPTKIIFESPPSTTNPRLISPCFVPPSPNRTTQPGTSPHPQQINSNQAVEMHLEDQTLANNENSYENDITATPTFPTHGPPPSVRDPSLVASHIMITSINVLNPYWTPGQIGEQQNLVTPHYETGKGSNNKTRRKNRKKSLKKRRRMAAKSKILDHVESKTQNHHDDCDMESLESDIEQEVEDEEEIRNEVEEAYQEFIKSGGHSLSTDGVNGLSKDVNGAKETNNNEVFKKNLSENWNQFNKIDRQSAAVGSKIAIRTWEISAESFTPELVIYYGKILESNEEKLKMKLDDECITKTEKSKIELEEENQEPIDYHNHEKDVHDDDEEEEKEEEEERQIDVKEAIRKTHRDALINHLRGHPSPEIRNWDWNNILDAIDLS